jgi:hypothetical protein
MISTQAAAAAAVAAADREPAAAQTKPNRTQGLGGQTKLKFYSAHINLLFSYSYKCSVQM